MNAQRLSAAVSLWALRNLIFAACLLIGSSCDKFIVPICELDPGNEVCVNTSAADGGLPDLTKRTPDSPLGPLRTFEWRAKINNNTQDQKFVGIDQKEYAISLVKDNSNVHFSAARFHLDRAADKMQLESVACTSCPLVDKIKFNVDRVFLVGEVERKFWLLRYFSEVGSYILNSDGGLIRQDDNLDTSFTRMPFFHPILSASLIPLKSSSGEPSEIVRLNIGDTQARNSIFRQNSITAATIGDIDSIDTNNGLEIVNFGGGFVESVFHFDPATSRISEDAMLSRTLYDVIQGKKLSYSHSIEAAYVDDLNGDGFLDFVFSVGGNIFVSSYKGKDERSGWPVFQSWAGLVEKIEAGEIVKSIKAIDLTKDGFPELIVETDKFVHFYLNKP